AAGSSAPRGGRGTPEWPRRPRPCRRGRSRGGSGTRPVAPAGGTGGNGLAIERGRVVARAGLEALHDLQRGEELADLLRPLGVKLGVLGGRRILATAAAVEEFGGEPLQRVAIRRGRRSIHRASLRIGGTDRWSGSQLRAI